jgi:protein arginine kinase
VIVEDLIRNPGSWLSRDDAAGIVLSSRVRLARNLAGRPFPCQARREERVRLCAEIRDACGQSQSLSPALFFDMGQLDTCDKQVLKERHLISREMAERGEGSGLLVADNERVAIMINEEDHLRLQAINPGDDLRTVWSHINGVDSDFERRMDFAFSPRLGYLTSCPSNVGTGLRASVMVHLPGLHLLEEVDAVCRGLTRIGLAVRGLFGEGSEAFGNMYQISNQVTLGRSEEEILNEVLEFVREVVQHERNARVRLFESRRSLLIDRVSRARAVLAAARLMTSEEMVELLSILRLGVECGLAQGIRIAGINELLLLSQPGHLQRMAGRALDAVERDELRARFGRERVGGVELDTGGP